MLYVSNGFSLNMIPAEMSAGTIRFKKMQVQEVKTLLSTCQYQSLIGHQDLANLVSQEIGLPVPFNRQTVTLVSGDQLVVAQYRGPRLPEGATTLPEGAVIEYYLVEIE